MSDLSKSTQLELSPDIDITSFSLSPEEGFLLSRIQGNITVKEVVSLSSLGEQETIDIIQKFVTEGILKVLGQPAETKATETEKPQSQAEPPQKEAAEKQKATPPDAVRTGDVDFDNLPMGLSLKIAKLIVDLHNSLNTKNHYELLGIKEDADKLSIRKAYFALSKDIHPDRYYGEDLGDWAQRIELIFAHISKANRVLNDKKARKAYDRKLRGETVEDDEKNPMKQRILKAKRLAEMGLKDMKLKRYKSAAANFQLAVAHDPWNKQYKIWLDKCMSGGNQSKADDLVKKALALVEMMDDEKALKLFNEAVALNPNDPEARHGLGRCLYITGENLHEAKEHCLFALTQEPKNSVFHVTMGKIYHKAGLAKSAEQEYKLAIEHDPSCEEAKKLLQALEKAR